ncbi:MAG: 3-hydroxyacyl-ACP dehydratase FabZ family protein [Phycisphaerae bacterium]|nr:3-hydroxyacyl-ACP dehydratase FabZ family protein [Phycisphaerae bacterium]
MHFRLIDTVLEREPNRVVALKNVSSAEEYLQDHFPGFPVLPGVFMVEAMAQAAREVLEAQGKRRYVLGSVRALRYGSFVRPGEALRVEVTVEKELPDGSVSFRGTGTVVRRLPSNVPDSAVAGRFTMRPIRRDPPPVSSSAS